MRLGVVSYLNTLPLACGLERFLPGATLVRTSPAEIARELEAGNLDVGLVPVAAWFERPDWTLIPGLGIASQGPVGSVVFQSRRPLAEIAAWAQDPASRTSNLLAAIWLQETLGRAVPALPGAATVEARLAEADATVCIGDAALFPTGRPEVQVDLGEAWTRWTGLPFVYALLARPGAAAPGLAEALMACYRDNASRLHELAHWESPHDPARRARIESYLRWNIRYRIGAEELRGLDRFRELVAAACPASPKVTHARS